jgi:tetratricopeptide (TPR) repeat protein
MVITLFATQGVEGQQDNADEAARIHFEAGTSYYETGDYELALQEFTHSYDLSHRPELQYNLSLTYEKLGDLDAAVEALDRYLKEGPDIPNRETLELRLANLKKRLEQQKQEEAQAQASLAAPAAPVEEPTSEETNSSQSATQGQPNQAQQAAEATPPPLPNKEAPTESTTSEKDSSDQRILGLPIEAFISYAVAGAGALTVILFGSLAVAEDDSLSDDCLNKAGKGICSAGRASTLNTLATVTDIGLGIALIGAITGTVFLLTTGNQPKEQSGLRVAPFVGTNNVGATAGVRF